MSWFNFGGPKKSKVSDVQIAKFLIQAENPIFGFKTCQARGHIHLKLDSPFKALQYLHKWGRSVHQKLFHKKRLMEFSRVRTYPPAPLTLSAMAS